MYWVGHRDLFALIRRTDRGLVWLNMGDTRTNRTRGRTAGRP
jgi:hypothetical protein